MNAKSPTDTLPTGPNSGPSTDPSAALKKLTKAIDEAFEEVAKLSGSNLPPTTFYQDFLARVLAGIEAPAGAVWLRTPQGFLQLQCQINLDKVGLDKHKQGRQAHNELLRQAFQTGKPIMLEPFARVGGLGEGASPAANLTEHLALLAPILADEKQVVGLLEVWQEPAWDARIHPTHLNYVVQMAGYASNYVRNSQNRISQQQEQVWIQLENYAKLIHSTLDQAECSHLVANEGRRLIGCDRLSVAIRSGSKCSVEAVSGSDVVEKASTQVRLMRRLFDAVVEWDEKLVFKGEKDETLPPNVLERLDEYLAESNAKLLVVQPIRDEREKKQQQETKKKRPARSALLMECFEPPAEVEPLINRLDVISGHAAGALYNAAEYKRIPFRFLWLPLAKIQDGLGGKTKAITFLVTALLAILIACMIFVPYPLRLDSKGELLPVERSFVYTSREGQIRSFRVDTGSVVKAGDELVRLFDPELQRTIVGLQKDISIANDTIRNLEARLTRTTNPLDRAPIESELSSERAKLAPLENQLNKLKVIHNCDLAEPGIFIVKAPEFSQSRPRSGSPRWTILSADFRQNLLNRTVRPSDPILRIGNKEDVWEIALKIPQKHIGQVLRAFGSDNPDAVLDVDLLLSSMPTATYKGKLYRKNVAREAIPNRDDHNESEPIVIAYVQINDKTIPEEYRIPREQLVTGVEIHAKVRCGNHAMGYSLFYGVWEFLYENVIFYF